MSVAGLRWLLEWLFRRGGFTAPSAGQTKPVNNVRRAADDMSQPLTGVLSTCSPKRPNPGRIRERSPTRR
jgi:hypothetical protein